jgi:hypothetical protein
MSVPAFAAEASLYKSPRQYRGYCGRTKLGSASSVESAFGACELVCEATETLAVAKCFAEYIWWNPVGLANCIGSAMITYSDCISDCSPSGGGGGDGGGHGPCNCPIGTNCCGRCDVQMVGLKPRQVCLGGCKVKCP